MTYEPKGAVEYVGGNARFLQISYGNLCEVSKRPIDGWGHPINQKTGEEIADKWVKVYKSVEGWVDKLEWYEHSHGNETYQGWKLHLSTKTTNYILDMPLNSGATKKFMQSARNMNFELPLEVAAWTDRKEGGLAVWLKQAGETILQYYKKGDMKDCPEPVQKETIGGKMKWDWDATDAFLWKEMQEVIAPTIERFASERGVTTGDTGSYSGSQQSSHAPAEKPLDPVAKNLGDMITSKQLGMIRAVAREQGVDPEARCNELVGCTTAELSKRAASYVIEQMNADRGVQPQPRPETAPMNQPEAPTTHPVTQPVPPDDDIPF